MMTGRQILRCRKEPDNPYDEEAIQVFVGTAGSEAETSPFVVQVVSDEWLAQLEAFAEEEKLRFVSLEVRVSNSAAVSLYEKLGFTTEGRRKDFYRNPREDALIMTKRFDYPDEDSEH